MEAGVLESLGAVDKGVVHGLITLLTRVVYAGIFWWAYHTDNRKRFEADAMLPFLDEEAPTAMPGREGAE